jgi:hypothetical protein
VDIPTDGDARFAVRRFKDEEFTRDWDESAVGFAAGDVNIGAAASAGVEFPCRSGRLQAARKTKSRRVVAEMNGFIR